jgi:hypothetical protein
MVGQIAHLSFATSVSNFGAHDTFRKVRFMAAVTRILASILMLN